MLIKWKKSADFFKWKAKRNFNESPLISKTDHLVDLKCIKWDKSVNSLLHAAWDSTLWTNEGIKSPRWGKLGRSHNTDSEVFSFPMKTGPDILWATYSWNKNPSHIVLKQEKPEEF